MAPAARAINHPAHIEDAARMCPACAMLLRNKGMRGACAQPGTTSRKLLVLLSRGSQVRVLPGAPIFRGVMGVKREAQRQPQVSRPDPTGRKHSC